MVASLSVFAFKLHFSFKKVNNKLLSFMPHWASMTKQKQSNTKVEVKETDPVWSQICSSRLHIEFL